MRESKLRTKFRDAIGEEPAPADLRMRTQAALKRELYGPRDRRLDWIPAVVAVLLGIALIASLLAIGAYRRAQAPTVSSPALSPALVYVQGQSAWQAVDWSGREHSSVGSDHVGVPYQSPDGSRLVWSAQGVWQIVDSRGGLLSSPDLSRSRGFTWADDSSGICVVEVINENPPNGGTYQLGFYSTAGEFRPIASLATQKGPNIAACSPTAGRVVITTASGYKDAPSEVRRITFGEIVIFDFKSGALLRRQTFAVGSPATEVNTVSVSHDGTVAALRTEAQTSIIRLLDGKVIARATGVTPLAFSWDNKLLVVEGSGNRGEVLQVLTGELLWRDSTSRVTQGAVADPRSSAVMLFVTSGGLNDLLVVAPDGSARVIATAVFPAQIAPCPDCTAF